MAHTPTNNLLAETQKQNRRLSFPAPTSDIAIFLNGERDITNEQFFLQRNYNTIIVCDGAWNSFATLMPTIIAHNNHAELCTEGNNKLGTKLIVLGDGDSITDRPQGFQQIDCQNTTDFEKALNYILSLNGMSLNEVVLNQTNTYCKRDDIEVDVFWANGGALDHTLGNLATACKYFHNDNNVVTCHFYTDKQYYRYVSDSLSVNVSENILSNNTFSLFPFPECTIHSSQGLTYSMHNYRMQMHTQQSLRNEMCAPLVVIEATGNYFIILEYEGMSLFSIMEIKMR